AYPVVVGAWRVPRHIELRDALDHVLTVHAVVSARPRRRPTMSSEPPRDIPRGGKPLRGLHRVDDHEVHHLAARRREMSGVDERVARHGQLRMSFFAVAAIVARRRASTGSFERITASTSSPTRLTASGGTLLTSCATFENTWATCSTTAHLPLFDAGVAFLEGDAPLIDDPVCVVRALRAHTRAALGHDFCECGVRARPLLGAGAA